jgi:hypothetical protein
MKQKLLLRYLILIIAAACNNATKQNTPHDTLTQANNITKASPDLKYKIDTSKQVISTLLPERDTLLTVELNANNKGRVSGYLSGIGKHVTIVIPVKGGDSLTAELIADDTANIRFNQIYIPAGKTGKYDGPFSRKISYPVTVKGDYRLIVGENLMAEGDWKGNFTCKVAIK